MPWGRPCDAPEPGPAPSATRRGLQRIGAWRRLRSWAKRWPVADAGFTLIELLVVVAIIGILTAFIVPKVIAALSSSVANTAVNSAQELAAAMESFYSANGYFPGCSKKCPIGSGAVSNFDITNGYTDSLITYHHLMHDLQPYLALSTTEKNADFWVVQGTSTAAPDPSAGNGASDDDITYAATANGYTLLVYAKNGEQSPIVIDVTAGTGGDIYAGAAANTHYGLLSGVIKTAPACVGGTCRFNDTVPVTW